MYMKLKDGKSKVLTLSYDDGVVQDIRLAGILDKAGIKCTFNINTGHYLPEDVQRERFYGRMKLSEAQALYKGSAHEVAVHSLTHPFLETLKTPQVLMEILEDRKNIEAQYGTLARGMAYPFGTYNDAVVEALAECGICYSRTVKSTEKFGFPENWLTLHPTCHHKNPRLMELAKQFVEETPRYGSITGCSTSGATAMSLTMTTTGKSSRTLPPTQGAGKTSGTPPILKFTTTSRPMRPCRSA